jgi:hypothetical protein
VAVRYPSRRCSVQWPRGKEWLSRIRRRNSELDDAVPDRLWVSTAQFGYYSKSSHSVITSLFHRVRRKLANREPQSKHLYDDVYIDIVTYIILPTPHTFVFVLLLPKLVFKGEIRRWFAGIAHYSPATPPAFQSLASHSAENCSLEDKLDHIPPSFSTTPNQGIVLTGAKQYFVPLLLIASFSSLLQCGSKSSMNPKSAN